MSRIHGTDVPLGREDVSGADRVICMATNSRSASKWSHTQACPFFPDLLLRVKGCSILSPLSESCRVVMPCARWITCHSSGGDTLPCSYMCKPNAVAAVSPINLLMRQSRSRCKRPNSCSSRSENRSQPVQFTEARRSTPDKDLSRSSCSGAQRRTSRSVDRAVDGGRSGSLDRSRRAGRGVHC